MQIVIEEQDNLEDEPRGPKRPRKIRDEAFGKRFTAALDAAPTVPEAQHGRLTWVARELERRGVRVSVETVRRWASGEVKPRAEPMRELSRIFACDEAWLTLGVAPGSVTPATRRRDISMATGAVPYVVGGLRLVGYTVGVPSGDAPSLAGVDAVVTTPPGRMIAIAAAAATPDDEGRVILRPRATSVKIYLVALIVEGGAIRTFVLTPEMQADAEDLKGDWSEIHGRVSKARLDVLSPSGEPIASVTQAAHDWPDPLT